MDRFLSLLLSEMEIVREGIPEREYSTIFFGGGTPSLLSGEQMQILLERIRYLFRVSADAEISMECNPGILTLENLKGYRDAGINRLSIGLQSANDILLKRIGRIHCYSDFLDAVENIGKAGFDNFNVDVMHGLPGQTEKQYLDTLQKVVDTGAVHISSYSLILEEGTPLFKSVSEGDEVLPEENETADMQDAGIRFLTENGYGRYEISNFSKPGYACRHNLNYWNNGEYLGLGPAAHSVLRINNKWTRWSNLTKMDLYEQRICGKEMPAEETAVIGTEEEMFETVMLGLRKTEGISIQDFHDRFAVSLNEKYKDPVQKLRDNGWLDEQAFGKGRLALNTEGLDFQNSALLLFMQ